MFPPEAAAAAPAANNQTARSGMMPSASATCIRSGHHPLLQCYPSHSGDVTMQEYVPMLTDALNMFIFLAAELSILFIVISAGVSLLQQYIPNEKIQNILGGHKGRGYLLAALLGAITPFCSCSTIPMLRGLLKAKAGFGQTLTFLFCSPLLNPIIIGLFIATFGIFTPLTYVCIALFISILAGYLLDKMKFEKYIIPEKRSPFESCCSSNISAPTCACESTVQSQGCCSLEQLQPIQPTSCCCGTSG